MVRELFINNQRWSAGGAKALSVAGVVAMLVSGLAGAESSPDRQAQFRQADVDGSRSLSREEVRNGLPKIIHTRFDEIDLDQDGQLSPDELRALQARQAELREARRAQRLRDLKRR
ncbi:hypothetical protein DEH80_11975 [Abyssibacter profundi]|uniref:EF-hand domain-containing protein n=1 Tax=Abyssibacter profundi TaxID=2182787 RepID=A0A363UJH6_9GAMM|nr:hypothetical protein DEH80_11975 [Abyssibacter profundi]